MKLKQLLVVAVPLFSQIGFAGTPALRSEITTVNYANVVSQEIPLTDLSRSVEGLTIATKLKEIYFGTRSYAYYFTDSQLLEAQTHRARKARRFYQFEKREIVKNALLGTHTQDTYVYIGLISRDIARGEQVGCLVNQINVLGEVLESPEHLAFLKEMKVDQIYVTLRDFRKDKEELRPQERVCSIKDGCVIFNIDAVLNKTGCHVVEKEELVQNFQAWEESYNQKKDVEKLAADRLAEANKALDEISEKVAP